MSLINFEDFVLLSPQIIDSSLSRFGAPNFDRRLSDKVLAAHNHAYAVGETVTAQIFMTQLEKIEETERQNLSRNTHAIYGGLKRAGMTAVDKAKLWSAYIDARNIYNNLNLRPVTDSESLRTAHLFMKQRYARWVLA